MGDSGSKEFPLVFLRKSVINERNIKKNPSKEQPKDKIMFSRIIGGRFRAFIIPLFYKKRSHNIHIVIIPQKEEYV